MRRRPVVDAGRGRRVVIVRSATRGRIGLVRCSAVKSGRVLAVVASHNRARVITVAVIDAVSDMASCPRANHHLADHCTFLVLGRCGRRRRTPLWPAIRRSRRATIVHGKRRCCSIVALSLGAEPSRMKAARYPGTARGRGTWPNGTPPPGHALAERLRRPPAYADLRHDIPERRSAIPVRLVEAKFCKVSDAFVRVRPTPK